MAVSIIQVDEHIPSPLNADPYTAFSITLDAAARGVVLLTGKVFATDHVQSSGHTFGGVSMQHIGIATDITGETAGYVHAMFLGSGLPASGSRSFSIDLSGTTSDPYAMYAVQLGGDSDLEVVDWDIAQEDQANPQVTLSYGGRTCVAVGLLNSGHDAVGSVTELSGMTRGGDHDYGNEVGIMAYQTTPGTSDFTFGFTATSEDVAMIALAISEVLTLQTVSPDADVTTTGWTTTPLWSKIDEDPASPDGTIITATAS